MNSTTANTLRELAERLDAPIKRYLRHAFEEAKQNWLRMFANIGNHPLLGISALGGLLGLIAYSKALMELHSMGLADDGLIGTADVASFTARLAVPFVLLAVTFALFAGALVTLLWIDHRNRRYLWATVFLALGTISVPLILLYLWSDPLGTSAFLFPAIWLVVALFLVCLFALLLYRAVSVPGVSADRRVQKQMLGILRLTSTAPGLLGVFVIIGLGLLFFTEAVSPLFWRQAPESANAFKDIQTDTTEDIRARKYWYDNARVVETKWHRTFVVGPSITRIGGNWILYVPKETLSEDTSWWQWKGNNRWVSLPNDQLLCIRRMAYEEKTFLCEKPDAKVDKPQPPPVVIGQETIGGIATHIFGCDPAALRSAPNALLTQFEIAQPDQGKTTDQRAVLGRWLIPGKMLFDLGIPDVPRSSQANVEQLSEFLRAQAQGQLWILGLASSPGTPSYNLDLSERRAISTQTFLDGLLRGYSPKPQLKTYGLGEHIVADLKGVQGAAEHQVSIAFPCLRAKDGISQGNEG